MASDRAYDARFCQQLALRDGTSVTLRLAGPQDKEHIRRGFEALSEESRYRRFLTVKSTLSEAELSYLSDLDGDHHFALGALREREGSEEGVGIGRFVRLRDRPHIAEPAISVIDALHGQGLGTALLQHLVRAAKERGITRFQCTVLAQNEPMRHLLEASDAEIVNEEVSLGLAEVTLVLPDTTSIEAVRKSTLHQMLSQVAGGSTAIALGRRLLAVLPPFLRNSP